MVDNLGVGFKYEDIFELCQKAAKLDMSKSTMSGGHIVDVGNPRHYGGFLDTGVDLGKAKKRLRHSFRKHVADFSDDEGKVLMEKTNELNIKIIGGITKTTLTPYQSKLYS